MKCIVSVDNNWCIGKDNDLLFNLKADMKFFKNTTWGYALLMGRKTFESLPKGALPMRMNFILSKSDKTYPNAITINNLEFLLSLVPSENIFLIGGENIYKQFYKLCDTIYVTKIRESKQGNKFFPNLDNESYTKMLISTGEENGIKYDIYKYEKSDVSE